MFLDNTKDLEPIVKGFADCAAFIGQCITKDSTVVFNVQSGDQELQVNVMKKYFPPQVSAMHGEIIKVACDVNLKYFNMLDRIGLILVKYFPGKYTSTTSVTYADATIELYEILRVYKPAYLREMLLTVLSATRTTTFDTFDAVIQIFRKAFDELPAEKRDSI